MTNHTPGPWRAYHDSHGRFQLIGPDGTPLDPESDDAQPGEGAANAALIAAAPDLLRERDDLLRERDELMTVLKSISAMVAFATEAKAGGVK